MPIDIRPEHLQIVYSILRKHLTDQAVWAFGSRAQGNAKQASDLDICIKGTSCLPFALLGHLRDDFSESNLPYKVDIVDWHSLSDGFKNIIERDKILLI
jgi:type I restriction enzyme S subunit